MTEKDLIDEHRDEILRILELVNSDSIFRMGKLSNVLNLLC
jgi:hypothetical protein